MGGQGSGRLPSEETIVKRMTEKLTPIASTVSNDLFLPNYSVVKASKDYGLLLPVGSIIMWSAATTPNGFLICNGAAVSRTTCKQLFDVIGTTYGNGNGSTTFNLPNFTDVFPVGAGNTFALAASATETATSTGYANVSDSGHSHSISSGENLTTGSGWSNGTDTGYANVTDSGHAHDYTPSHLAINFLIKYRNPV